MLSLVFVVEPENTADHGGLAEFGDSAVYSQSIITMSTCRASLFDVREDTK
jgi:hypothetical protein